MATAHAIARTHVRLTASLIFTVFPLADRFGRVDVISGIVSNTCDAPQKFRHGSPGTVALPAFGLPLVVVGPLVTAGMWTAAGGLGRLRNA
jgi:hypothetical protein